MTRSFLATDTHLPAAAHSPASAPTAGIPRASLAAAIFALTAAPIAPRTRTRTRAPTPPPSLSSWAPPVERTTDGPHP
jgi:hypothetical protein